MKILAIETSCDETAMAIVESSSGIKNPQFKVLKNIVSSQTKIHAPFGGVVPNLAKREHLKNLPIILRRLNLQGRFNLHDIDLLAVTVGPGLEPALWTGVNFAKDLAKEWGKPLVGVNHLEGHLYSFLLANRHSDPPRAEKNLIRSFAGLRMTENIFPAISLIVSGGHTILLLMKDFLHYKKLGETRDDAAGEAYDKVAKMMGLLYPGGPVLEKLAREGNPSAIEFPRPMMNQKNYEFSFSGLKTSVFYYLRDRLNLSSSQDDILRANVAASFEQAVIDVLVHKASKARQEFSAKSIMLSGGVAANKKLRKNLQSLARKNKIPFLVAPQKFNTDNAAMIGVAAYFNYLNNKKRKITAQAHLNL